MELRRVAMELRGVDMVVQLMSVVELFETQKTLDIVGH